MPDTPRRVYICGFDHDATDDVLGSGFREALVREQSVPDTALPRHSHQSFAIRDACDQCGPIVRAAAERRRNPVPEFSRVEFATGQLANAWTGIAHDLTPEERLDVLAYFTRLILDKGDGTWVWPPQERNRDQPTWPLIEEAHRG